MKNIIDTAGIREENENKNIDEIEKIGITKSKQIANSSDLILYMIDVSNYQKNDNIEILNFLNSLKKPYIILLNKIDLIENSSFTLNDFDKNLSIEFSTKTRKGLDELKEKIKTLFSIGQINLNTELLITNERQLLCLKNAFTSLCNTEKTINENFPEDLWTIDLTNTYKEYSNILGEEINDDIINNIFSKFCMGK